MDPPPQGLENGGFLHMGIQSAASWLTDGGRAEGSSHEHGATAAGHRDGGGPLGSSVTHAFHAVSPKRRPVP